MNGKAGVQCIWPDCLEWGAVKLGPVALSKGGMKPDWFTYRCPRCNRRFYAHKLYRGLPIRVSR